MIEEAVYNILTGRAALMALATGGVHHQTLPQATTFKPAVTWNITTDQEEYSLDGPERLHLAYCDIVGWGADATTAYNLADEARKAFNGYRGTLNGVEIQKAEVTVGSGLFEPASAKYQRPIEVSIGYKEV